MTKANREHALAELEALRERADMLAEHLDPGRTFGRTYALDEPTRAAVKAADQIGRQATAGISMLRVTA